MAKAIEVDKENKMRWHLARDYAQFAKLKKWKGDRLKARESMSEAISIMTECGADGWVERYRKEMDALS